MRRYPFQHMHNVRDLGGYPVSLTAQTQFQRFIRCDAPIQIEEEEFDFLQGIKVNTVIDFRSKTGMERRSSAFEGREGFDYYRCEMFVVSQLPQAEAEMADMYFAMVEAKGVMGEIFRIIAHAPHGVLYHCTAGKDRTGVISALLLSLAGVARSDIMADYQVSYTYLETIGFDLEKMGVPLFIGQSKPEYLQGFWDKFDAAYGNVESYMHALGLTQEEIQAIREKLLTP